MGKRIEFITRGLCVEDEHVLICVNTAHNYGYLPGGHVDFEESAESALKREFVEECGIDVAVGEPLLGLELSFVQGEKERHEVSLVFPVKRLKDDPVRSLEPKIRFEWWPLAKLSERDFRPALLRDWIVHSCRSAERGMVWLSGVHNP